MKLKSEILIVIAIGIIILPSSAFAANRVNFIYAGWLPFWKQTSGIQDVTDHLRSLNEISPFSYETNVKGTLIDKLKINSGAWPNWFSAIRRLNIKIIPTVAWFDGAGLHKLLSNTRLRQRHENAIAALVRQKNFDGIDIDYENKKVETKNYFSLFIQGLAMRLHAGKKLLTCTIESRTPADSLSDKPDRPDYVNDYAVLDKYCDEVRVMAYDQGIIDIKLDASKGADHLYAPVADPDWVRKVLSETLKTIDPKKIMLGVPTYGYEYRATMADGQANYTRLRSYTYTQAVDKMKGVNATPQRNSAGELSFTYNDPSFPPASSYFAAITSGLIPPAQPGATTTTRLVWFSDAAAIADKIALAKKLKLKGVILFKLDGEADPAVWDELK